MSQQNKVALVTGASRGIGHAIAFALGRTGITLIGTATTQEGADKITQVLKTAGMLGFQNSTILFKELLSPAIY